MTTRETWIDGYLAAVSTRLPLLGETSLRATAEAACPFPAEPEAKHVPVHALHLPSVQERIDGDVAVREARQRLDRWYQGTQPKPFFDVAKLVRDRIRGMYELAERDLQEAIDATVFGRLPKWTWRFAGFNQIWQSAPDGTGDDYRGLRRHGRWVVDHHPDWPFFPGEGD